MLENAGCLDPQWAYELPLPQHSFVLFYLYYIKPTHSSFILQYRYISVISCNYPPIDSR